MKIRIDIDEEAAETEVVIKCREVTDEVVKLQNAVLSALAEDSKLPFIKSGKEYFLSVNQLLFFESTGGKTYAHTATDVFETKLKLYELENILPGSFVRASKSAIICTDKILSIAKNITGPSVVEFSGSHKKINVSRQYFNILRDMLNQ
jgi:DNA-binding LytR/AlgR family response regulator